MKIAYPGEWAASRLNGCCSRFRDDVRWNEKDDSSGSGSGLVNGVDLVSSTTDPAFTVDSDGVIRAWNAAAEEAFDLTASDACGRACWQVLAGKDGHGNDYCCEGCPLLQMALAGKPVHRGELFFADGNGKLNPYSIGTLLLRGARPVDPAVVHILQRRYREPSKKRRDRRGYAGNHARGEITPRELEVLRLLGDGTATEEIGRTLCISTSTARNHVQHILHKLHVHSRLEAVVTARKTGLI